MALPKLNSSPKYELTIPSTGKTVRFRPFLVKEQKVLLIAYESKDKKQVIHAILDTIRACAEDEINVNDLTTFDVDYIFTQIRAKSVGEKVDLRIKCTHCESFNDIQINIEDIKVEVEEGSKVVKLTDEISVKLRYPNYGQFLKNPYMFDSKSDTQTVLEIIVSCIESVMTEEENISLKDESREEIERFIDSMTSDQFEKISEFVQKMPQLKHDVSFTCTNCEEVAEAQLRGIDDFF